MSKNYLGNLPVYEKGLHKGRLNKKATADLFNLPYKELFNLHFYWTIKCKKEDYNLTFEEYLNETEKIVSLNCKYCDKQWKDTNSLKNHIIRCKNNPNKLSTNNLKDYNKNGRSAWNKGLTKESHPSLGMNRPNFKGSNSVCFGTHLSNERKLNLSIKRTEYLLKNPDKVPYLLNHSSKESYPEKYFTEILDNNNLHYEKEYQIALYSLDFGFIDAKIDLEIDGEQHYVDKKIVESDKRRSDYLESLGWKIIRVRWSKYKKLLDNERKEYINRLLIELDR
jgi:very-short-patch-repair endonuclease